MSRHLQWGGPGTGGGTMAGTGAWVLPALLQHLAAKFEATGRYDCDFIAWHNKGALPGEISGSAAHRHAATSCNSLVDLSISSFIAATHPAIASALPLGNEEVDPLGGWNHTTAWHSDARNAAAIVRILAMHEDMIEQVVLLLSSVSVCLLPLAARLAAAPYSPLECSLLLFRTRCWLFLYCGCDSCPYPPPRLRL